MLFQACSHFATTFIHPLLAILRTGYRAAGGGMGDFEAMVWGTAFLPCPLNEWWDEYCTGNQGTRVLALTLELVAVLH